MIDIIKQYLNYVSLLNTLKLLKLRYKMNIKFTEQRNNYLQSPQNITIKSSLHLFLLLEEKSPKLFF